MTNNETFTIIQKVYETYFPESKIVRATILLDEIYDNDEKISLVQQDHIGNNHRRIDETVLHLKRKYYFPQLNNSVQNYQRLRHMPDDEI